jgi:dipeptidyl aminopeptidase/acylaminoacyl peptidase
VRVPPARTWPVVTLVLAAALATVGAEPGQAQTLRSPTTADFVDLHELDEVYISADGAWLAAVIREASSASEPGGRGERGVYVMPSDGSAPLRQIAPELGVATGPQWSPDGRLGFLAQSRGGGQQIYIYRPDGAETGARQATSGEQAVSRFRWSPTGDEIAFLAAIPRATGGAGRTGVWILDVATGEASPLTPADVNIRDLAWSPSGGAVVVIAAGGGEPGTNIRVVERSGAMRTIAGDAGGPGTRRQVLDWSPDGRTILYSRSAPSGQAGQYLALAPVDGGPVRELLRDYEGIVMRAVWGPDGQIIAQSFEGLLSRLLRVDPASGAVTRLADIMDSYPTFSVTADGSTFAYRGDRLEGPADIWVWRDGAARRVTHLNPHLDEVALGAVREFTWTNPEDGTRLEGVLVLPPDYRSGVRYPTIMQLHGGPHFHWGLGWLGDWHDWAQLLASRGYVVFLPNPRGSTGRGTAFASAIIGDIGGVDYRDVMSGVDALIERGIADPHRLGVGGWSYGGFLTARTITQTDRFKGAVMGAGISNLFSFAGTPGLGRGWASSFFGTNPYADRAVFEDRSATTHLANVRTPTLVVHGERDAKISVTQAWELHYGLEYVGVDTDILIFPGAGHGLTARQDRMDYLTGVVDWFDRYVKSDTGGAVASPGEESS